jgi:hypothetical protein
MKIRPVGADLFHATEYKDRQIRRRQYYLFAILQRSLKIKKRKKADRKIKAVPLQAWSGPDGSRKLRFPDFITIAQDSGKVVSFTHRPPLPTGNTLGTHFSYRLSRP